MLQSVEIEGLELINLLVRLLRMPDYARDVARRELSKAGQELVAIEKNILSDARYTGNMESSIWYAVEGAGGDAELIVGPNVAGNVADPGKVWAIWKGGPPGRMWVPIETLSGWMSARGIPPHLARTIQWTIHEKGTSTYRQEQSGSPDWPFPEETLESARGQAVLKGIAENTLTQVMASIGEQG
jgi:hypothetical protein